MLNNHTTLNSNRAVAPIWEYHIIAERCSHPDIGVYRSYGIHAFKIIGGHIRPAAVIHDITTIQSQAEALAQLCNAYQVSPIHLHDVINDFFAKTS